MNIEKIQEAVCMHYTLPPEAMTSRTIKEPALTARMMAIYICLQYEANTTTKVAKYFNRDHSSIVKSKKTFGRRLKHSDALKADFFDIQANLAHDMGVDAYLDEMIAKNVKNAALQKQSNMK